MSSQAMCDAALTREAIGNFLVATAFIMALAGVWYMALGWLGRADPLAGIQVVMKMFIVGCFVTAFPFWSVITGVRFISFASSSLSEGGRQHDVFAALASSLVWILVGVFAVTHLSSLQTAQKVDATARATLPIGYTTGPGQD